MQRATFLAGSSAYRSQTFSNWRSTDHSPTPRESKTAAQSTPQLARSRSRYSAISLQSAEVAVPKSESISTAYEFRTKSAKSGGLETNGRRERILGPQPVPRSAEVFTRRPAIIRLLRTLESQRRMFGVDVLAEGEDLPTNSLWVARRSPACYHVTQGVRSSCLWRSLVISRQPVRSASR